MILIKMGGSVITDKSRALHARKKAIDAISGEVKKIKEATVIVHGGGSYGHYWSVRYDMHTKPAEYDLHGVSVVKNSMIELDRMVLESLTRNGINPYSVPPADFMYGDRPIAKKIRELEEIAESGLVPVTYGDALWYGQKKSYILSGDKIMTHLTRILRPRLAIFALNVDGVYSDPKSKKLIGEIGREDVKVAHVKADVTGGMGRKLEEARNISRLGSKVFFVNGNKPRRIANAVKKNRFEGTVFGVR